MVPWDSIEKLLEQETNVDVVITQRELKPDATKVCASCCLFYSYVQRGNIVLKEALYRLTSVQSTRGARAEPNHTTAKKPGILPFACSSVNFLKEALAPAPVKGGRS